MWRWNSHNIIFSPSLASLAFSWFYNRSYGRSMTVGKTQTPTSSFLNLHWRLSQVILENFTVVPSEVLWTHSRVFGGLPMCRLQLNEVNPFFSSLFSFCRSSVPRKGIGWRAIPSFWFGGLLHPKTTCVRHFCQLRSKQIVDHHSSTLTREILERHHKSCLTQMHFDSSFTW